MRHFNKIISDIKSLKIQGASKVAKAGLLAYYMKPSAKTINLLLNLRPTEPALEHALNLAKKCPKNEVLSHFSKSQEKINSSLLKIIKDKRIIFTHCHSNTVSNAMIHLHKTNKKFQVFNTETRPLYQGRITSKKLAKAGIKVTTYVDSAMHEAITKSDLILLGADAILKSGAINKIGSTPIAEIAKVHKKPLYILSDSWKFSSKKIEIEFRPAEEVWRTNSAKIKIKNPSFELIPKKYISKIISELGVLSHKSFILKARDITSSIC